MQIPIGAAPVRRRLGADATDVNRRKLEVSADECIYTCTTLGLPTPFYAAISGDDCLCSPGR